VGRYKSGYGIGLSEPRSNFTLFSSPSLRCYPRPLPLFSPSFYPPLSFSQARDEKGLNDISLCLYVLGEQHWNSEVEFCFCLNELGGLAKNVVILFEINR
jgi:hypothetical protein